MNVPQRLTRAALTLLLFGTIAALLPSLDTAALAVNGCFTGPAGGKGKFAVAPSQSNIHDTYTLTSPATTYFFYYQSPLSSNYTALNSGVSTTFTVNSGKVYVNGIAFAADSNPKTATTSASFLLSKISIYQSGKVTGFEPGSVTITSTYADKDSQGNKITYTATAVVSNP